MLVTDAVPGMTVHVTKADDPGTDEPLAWTDDQIEAESIITDEDLERAEATIRERSTTLGDFLDSPPVKNALPVETKESYRWNPRTRRYIGANGRMVPKAAVDAAVDEAVKASREVMAGYADRLISGDWSLVDYQLAMRDEIKTMQRRRLRRHEEAGGISRRRIADGRQSAYRNSTSISTSRAATSRRGD
jgi:hypothetical protein